MRDARDGYGGLGRDTCTAMAGRVSVVSIVSNTWAQHQVESFVAPRANAELERVLRESGDMAQRVDVNVEENALKWWLLQFFASNLRRKKSLEEQGRYFMVRRGLSEVMKEALGLLNDKVGYVYLVDTECKIRWAGSAIAKGYEKESMVRGLRRLVQEARTPAEKRVDEKHVLEGAVAKVLDEPEFAADAR